MDNTENAEGLDSGSGIEESGAVSEQAEGSSSGVQSGERAQVSEEKADERVKKLEKQLREFQSKYDKAEVRLREIERSNMSEDERVASELQEAREQISTLESMLGRMYMEKTRDDLVFSLGISPELRKLIPLSDIEEMREAAELLAEKLGKRSQQAPFVPGGTPVSEQKPPPVDRVKELLEKGDVRGALEEKIERLTRKE